MRSIFQIIVGMLSLVLVDSARAAGAGVTLNGQSAGPTPFISLLDATATQAGALTSVQFTVQPKAASVTRPISATYSSAYLQRRGYLDTETGHLTVPIFGLYAQYSNTVQVTFSFNGQPAQTDSITIPTAAFADPTGVYTNPTVLQARAPNAKLSYDFIMLKNYASDNTPIIIDTDGEVRWVGTSGDSSQPAMMYQNGIYVSSGTSVTRLEFDGTFAVVGNYTNLNVTTTGHHNFDPGKHGILVEVNTTTSIESVIIEIDGSGNVLKTWNVEDIIRDAMIAGGDDPSAFVRAGDDWFHNNSCAYWPREDSLIVSGREDFVIALDYETGAIRWILGDSTKAWYQYPSLRQYALTLGKNTLPPIGQHSVSFTRNNQLLLFDDGKNSDSQTPPGDNRTYSAPRRYKISSKKMTAKEVWNYPRNESVYSPYCSSIYEDSPKNYLIDYTLGGPYVFTEVLGLNSKKQVVFDYSYPTINFCGVAWNAIMIHLENMVFE